MLSSHKNDVESFTDGACWCVKVWLDLFDIRVTTCLENRENLEMSGNYTDVREMSGISLKVMEMSGNCPGKI